MKTLWTALTEPNRLHIIELLRDGPLTVGEITERLGLAAAGLEAPEGFERG